MSGDKDGSEQYLASDRKRVIVGNFDSNGLNVNTYHDDDRNSNVGVTAVRQ